MSSSTLKDETSKLRLIRPPQLADALGITPGTLAKMRLSGRGPKFCRVGRAIAYDPREVERWLCERTFRSTAEATAAAKEAP